MKNRSWLTGLGCGLAVLVCILAIHPQAEIGIIDDWSYIFSAKRLAETGHIMYNGWAAPILGVQLPMGAFMIRIFGFSFLAVRSSSMLLGILTAPMAYATFSRCGIRPWSAALAVLTLTLSPVYLSLATIYMSDIFAMFFMVFFFYAAVRCVQAATPRSMLLWLLVATIVGLIGGSVRQTVFLGNLAALPGLTWCLRRRRGMVPAGLSLWAASLVVTIMMVHWFGQQPYTAIEKPIILPHLRGDLLHVWLPRMAKSVVSVLVLMLPVSFAIALKFPLRQQSMTRRLILLLASVASFVAILSFVFGGAWWGHALLGNHAQVIGIVWDIIGPQPLAVPPGVQIAVAFLLIGTTLVAVWTVRDSLKHDSKISLSEFDLSLLWMAIPFVVAYLALVYTRAFIYDRYFLPILFLGMLFALRWFEQRFQTGVSWLCIVPLVILAYYGVAATHDRFAGARAELAATQELQSAGLARTEIDGGFEYNGWTELETVGHVNEPRIHPSSAYHPFNVPEGLLKLHPIGSQEKCYTFFYTYNPSVHGRYAVQRAPNYCFIDAAFSPIRYRTWLPPYDNAVYIGVVPSFQ